MYLHWLAIYLDAVELLGGGGSKIGLVENDGSDSSAATGLVVSEHNSPD